jgi:hypothetical protein
MNRAIVLILCLAGAAGIAVYSHSPAGDQAVVYTVPQRSEPAANPPVTPPPKAIETPGDRVTLIRTLQFELKRVGCYSGEVNGVWTTSSRMAMKSFTGHVNASLPIDTPDYVLLSMVQSHQGQACAPSPARAAKAPAPADTADEKAGALVATGAAAAAVAIAAPKPDVKAATPDDRPRPAAVPPQEGPPPGKGVQREGAVASGGPVPPEGMQEPRPRRTKQAEKSAQPPKFVRDFLKTLGFK